MSHQESGGGCWSCWKLAANRTNVLTARLRGEPDRGLSRNIYVWYAARSYPRRTVRSALKYWERKKDPCELRFSAFASYDTSVPMTASLATGMMSST